MTKVFLLVLQFFFSGVFGNSHNQNFHNYLKKEKVSIPIKHNSRVTDANLYIQYPNKCDTLQEFTITDNNTFDCHEKNLQIHIATKDSQNKNISYVAYLMQYKIQFISTKQEIVDACQFIKK